MILNISQQIQLLSREHRRRFASQIICNFAFIQLKVTNLWKQMFQIQIIDSVRVTNKTHTFWLVKNNESLGIHLNSRLCWITFCVHVHQRFVVNVFLINRLLICDTLCCNILRVTNQRLNTHLYSFMHTPHHRMCFCVEFVIEHNHRPLSHTMLVSYYSMVQSWQIHIIDIHFVWTCALLSNEWLMYRVLRTQLP
jgi:hypothetical protein